MESLYSLYLSAIVLSALHGIIPSHWLPLLAMGEKHKWTFSKLIFITFIIALIHIVSTLIIGITLAFLGIQLQEKIEIITHSIAGGILILLGFWFIIRHFHHHHFHIHSIDNKNQKSALISIALAMFLSPCLEIGPLFVGVSAHGWQHVIWLSLVYAGITLVGMLVWVAASKKLLEKINTHAIEHYSGIFSGLTLVICGLLLIFLH